MEQPTAIFAAIRGFALANSRTLLIQHSLNVGWLVIVATRPDEHARRLESLGAELATVPDARGGFSPSAEVRSWLAMRRLYRQVRPQLVHHFNAKPVLFGCLAAGGVSGVHVFNTITGLGYAFSGLGLPRAIASWGYQALMSHSDAVAFQNSDDLRFFQEQGWTREQNSRLILSSGVDTERFRPRQERSSRTDLRVLMSSRLIWQKGVREFAEAATQLRGRFPHVCFQLAGEWEPEHPDAVDKAWVENLVSRGIIEFLGYLNDMHQVLAETDLFVLPSAYREGAPRVLLEAGACGVPVITTDAPGCREVVHEGVTGRLIPTGDARALAMAMQTLLEDGFRREQYGMAGRRLMVERFDMGTTTEKHLDLYRQVGLNVDLPVRQRTILPLWPQVVPPRRRLASGRLPTCEPVCPPT